MNDDQSTADTGPAASPASRQREPLLELPAPLYARRSWSEDAWPSDTETMSWTLDDDPTKSDVSTAVASILSSPAFLLALSQLDNSQATETACPAAELLASLLPALANDDNAEAPWSPSHCGDPTADPWGSSATDQAALLPPGLLANSDWASLRPRALPRRKKEWLPSDDEFTSPKQRPPGERSKLLHEFRSGQTAIGSLYVLKNQMFEFALDQAGARFIQQRLAACPPQEAQFAREMLLPKTMILVTDVFGNHIVQRLLETGTPHQRHQIFLQLKGDILRLALQTYGCRVLQKALETLGLEDKLAFVSELQAHVVRCVEDQNGNHVIQKCIERLPVQQTQFIIDAFRGQVARVAAHCYGCRVIQRVLEHCPVERIQHLLDEVMDKLIRLAQDQYGNYVVQHVLRYGRLEDRQAIVDRIASDLLMMSSHKFSSNVVEKCLELRATPDARRKIIRAAFGDNADPRPPIMQMVRDRYANYVVQRMLEVTTQENSEGLIDEVVYKLERHMPALRKFTYGKHIAAALERLRKAI